ncbi:MAG: DNA polymerase III subunit delta [Solirubrobacteraceae bacterium]
MSVLKPAYLIHGDDHGRVGERRARLRALAGNAWESAATPQEAAALLSSLTLSLGWRVIVGEGVERWSDADVQEHVVPALAAMAPETTIAFFALEDGRAKAPASLHAAVKAVGGDVSVELAVKEWELPRWVIDRAAELELKLDTTAAKALVQAVGTRQARLSRELEKLSIECGPGAALDAEAVLDRVARGAERKAWTLADALVARDAPSATSVFLELREQGERVESLAYWMARRLREALAVALQLHSGTPQAQVRAGLRMPPKAAAAFIADVQRTDAAQLRRALTSLADLELSTRGGSPLDPDTLALRAIAQIAA